MFAPFMGVGDMENKFNRIQFKEQLKERLKDLPVSRITYLAWYSAVTTLPLLSTSNKTMFSYWENNDIQKHLYSVFNAIDLCYFLCLSRDVVSADSPVDAASVDAISTAGAAYTAADKAVYAARSAAYATRGDADHSSAYASAYAAADAARSAAYADAATAFAAVYDVRFVSYADGAATYASAAAADAYAVYTSQASRRTEKIRYDLFIKTFLRNIEMIISGNYKSLRIDVSLYGSTWTTFIEELRSVAGDYWANLYENLFNNGLQMDDMELERRLQVPVEYQEKGAKTVAIFLEDTARKGLTQLAEIRLILLGEKGAGKTSFVRRIMNEELRMDEESTIGIDYRDWDIKVSEHKVGVRIHLWDFAGHVITHSAYPMFLTSGCVYVLIYDGRTEERNRIKYWLNTIKNYAYRPSLKPPVFLFVNLRDPYKPKISERTLRETYTELDIKEITYCNLLEDKLVFKLFQNKLTKWIQSNPKLCTQIVATSLPIKDSLEAEFKGGNYVITKEKLLSKMKDTTEGTLDRGLHLLLPLGIVLWYEHKPRLENYIFEPSWVSQGVYSILNWLGTKEKYELFTNDLDTIFQNQKKRYPQKHYSLLQQIMIEYGLAYSEKRVGIGEETYLVVPTTMPVDQPVDNIKAGFPDNQCLVLRCRFVEELPPDTISRFIVMHHKDIDVSGEIALVWRYGVQLKHKGQFALVLEEDRMITLRVLQSDMHNGEASQAYFNKLHESLVSIFEQYRQAMPSFEHLIQDGKDSIYFNGEQMEYIKRIGGSIMNFTITGGQQQGINVAGINEGTQIVHQTINNFNPMKWNYEMREQLELLADDLQRKGFSEEADELTACVQDLKEAENWKKPQEFHGQRIKARLKRLKDNLGNNTSNLSKALTAIGLANGIWNLSENINQLFQWILNSPLG
jgi:GTPase SAR1 family protein